jgi:hypothetical protein
MLLSAPKRTGFAAFGKTPTHEAWRRYAPAKSKSAISIVLMRTECKVKERLL